MGSQLWGSGAHVAGSHPVPLTDYNIPVIYLISSCLVSAVHMMSCTTQDPMQIAALPPEPELMGIRITPYEWPNGYASCRRLRYQRSSLGA